MVWSACTYHAVAGGLDADVERGGGRREGGRADGDEDAGHREPPPGAAARHPPGTSTKIPAARTLSS
jgi:hypothetical protein